jgi:ribosomal protein S1
MSEKNQMHEFLENYEVIKIFPGKQIKGTIITVESDKALVNFGYKSDGVLLKENYTTDNIEDLRTVLNVGDEIEAAVISNSDDDGNVLLSRKQFEEQDNWNEILELQKNDTVITITIKSANEKGAIANLKGYSGFVPASHLSIEKNIDPKDYIGKKMDVKIIEAKIKNNKTKLIFSRKAIELEMAKANEAKAWDSIEVKEVYEGKVNRLADFGAFVEINGVEGLLHINEISWNRIKHPSEVLKEGDFVSVKVLKKDTEKKRMSLSLKSTIKRPFELFTETYKQDDIVTGKVVSLTDFGAFVEIDNVQGLLHVSDISWDMVKHPQDVLKIDDEIEVKILKIDSSKERLSLGMKQLSEDPFMKYTKNLKRFDTVVGTVKSMSVEGVTVQLADEIEGFVPINKVSKDKLRTPAQILEKDQEVQCKVTDINRRSKSIKLSMIVENEKEENKSNHEEQLVSYKLGDDNFTIGDLFNNKK